MLRVSELKAAIELSQSLGLNPNEPLCDRHMSPDEWRRAFPSAMQPVQPYSPQQKIVVLDRKEKFYNPRIKRYKHVPVVRMPDGQETPKFHPIDVKTGRPYDDFPF